MSKGLTIWLKRALIGIFTGSALCLGTYFTVLKIAPFPYEAMRNIQYSKCIFDSQGNLLRTFTNKDGLWLIPVELKEINPQLINATLSIEDNRFKKHFGVDPFAVIRAAKLNLNNGRIISGASTISMQVVRIVENRKRSLPNKIIEAVHTIRLETLYSKEQILKLYFEIAPYGGNIHGVKAASLRYFNKQPADLTLSECALLAGIPQSPSKLRPNRYPDRAKKRRDRVLASMVRNGYITKTQNDEASGEPVLAGNNLFPFKAPHFADFVNKRYTGTKNIRTTIDPAIQNFAENTIKEAIQDFRPYGVTNGAIVVIENSTGMIRAMVGSADFFSKENSGQVNGALSKRCPGSTLKPFTYALGFEEGAYTPKMILADVPVQYDGYAPLDYDKEFRGPVTAREALIDSLNIPAVEVLDKIGYRKLYQFLEDSGVTTLKKLPDHYGLALTLGSGDVNLLELTNAYATLARLGEYKPYSFIEEEEGLSRRLLSEGAAYLVADIISDTKRLEEIGIYRDDKIHPKVAWKTGTSYGHKDAWTICYNPEYTVGIWLGNFSARPARVLVGVNTAAPLAMKIFDWLYVKRPAPWYKMPDSIGERKVCALSGEPASKSCPHSVTDLYIKHCSLARECTIHGEIAVASNKAVDLDKDKPKIISPSHKCEYFVSGMQGEQKLKLEAAGATDVEKLYWFVDGKFYNSSNIGGKILWDMELGRHRITCSDELGRSSSIMVIVR
jgi:penicillin-binding protein 1C